MQHILTSELQKAIATFPRLFDERLMLGLNKIAANSPPSFLTSRTHTHLKSLLLAQFFLQRKMENALKEGNEDQNTLFLKLFRTGSRICCSLAFLSSYGLDREQLLNILHTLLPGVQEIPSSFYMWFHPELSYRFCYMELEKLRGKDLSTKDLRLIEKSLREQLLALPPLTPALFWPYNEEESFRQVLLLRREIQHPEELPHISILFQEQTLASLEFLIHYVRPKADSLLENSLKQLPHSFGLFWRFQKTIGHPFPIEIGAFSLKVPSSVFDVRGSINLLYTRRYIAKYLETVFGPFRDYNGGLFEKQQHHFEVIRVNLSDKIPLFDLFAEKVFYALQPIEARLALSLKNAENLLTAFAEIIQMHESFAVVQKEENLVVIKNRQCTDFLSARFKELEEKSDVHAYLKLGNADYFCCLGANVTSAIPNLLQKNEITFNQTKILRLSFQEGVPLSLNPHLASGDMRCRLLSKLLFEGLMRLNAQGIPESAGALSYSCLDDGLRYQFKLRPSFWSNGEKVTAIDYVTSWQNALREYISHPEHLFVLKNGNLFKEGKCSGNELGIKALDTNVLEITLERPDSRFLHKLAQPFFFPLFGSMREPKWFNGPYIISRQSRDGLMLERNPYFWNINHSFFEEIEIKWHPDVYSLYQLFQEGKTDWIGDPLSTLSPQIVQHLNQHDRLMTRKVNRRFLVHFNTRLPHLASPRIRQALSIAIERPEICASLFPHSILLQPRSPCAKDARELFEEGLKELRLTKNEFPPLKFSYSHQTGREELALYLQSLWEKKLGVSVRLEKNEWNLFRNKLERGEFEITATIQETLEDAPLEFLERFEGSSSWNFSQWQNPLYRECISRAAGIKDEKQRRVLIERAEKILLEEAPFTPLFRCTHLFAHHPALKNYFFDSEGCVDFSRAFFTEDIDNETNISHAAHLASLSGMSKEG